MGLPNDLEAAIYGRLAAGTALVARLGGTAIYNDGMPRGLTRPLVEFTYVSGVDDNMTPTDSVTWVYQVKAIADTQEEAGVIAALIHERLQHCEGTITVPGHGVFAAYRIRTLRYVERDPAEHVIAHAGGDYQFRLE